MPRYLYLLRHAQSADKQPGQTDKERELASAGIRQAILVGSFLLAQKSFPDAIICSSAVRTQTTAMLIGECLKLDAERIIVEDELYDASTRTFLQTVSHFDDGLQHVLCIGHNPAISYLAEFLTKAEIGEMVPAGLAIVQLEINSWSEAEESRGELIRYITPDEITLH